MADKFTEHYNNIQHLQTLLGDHYWGKSITRKDGEFLSLLDKKLQDICNEAFTFTNAYEVQTRKNSSDIPLGATCHYERIDNKWYVVWDVDFQSDEQGCKLVDDNEAIYLEMGYQTAKTEGDNKCKI